MDGGLLSVGFSRGASDRIPSTHILHNSVRQQEGRSFRTGAPLSQLAHSNIRDHCAIWNVSFDISIFRIFSYASSEFELRLLESLYIFRTRPKFNDMQSAAKLLIINR